MELIYTTVKAIVLPNIQALHKTSQRDQFLMHLCFDFKMVRSNLPSHTCAPSLDTCLNKLLCEEQLLASQSRMEEHANPSPIDVVHMVRGPPQRQDLSKLSCTVYLNVFTTSPFFSNHSRNGQPNDS
ncbi:hypothetical protein Ddye_015365 [Dipteronia dyeriana]|uniref:Uncharacterized protein n=1 Tax=Dipteronia dyeriana TaxID=168575 RepID=A0AAD9U4Q3_9ROSI|nr:hypothetical protein Ddye_015365 [Dipteronia dyeriana]